MIGDSEPCDIYERTRLLYKRFTKKHKLDKGFVEWDDEELATVGPDMRKWISAKQAQRKAYEARAAHMYLISIKLGNWTEEMEDADDSTGVS